MRDRATAYDPTPIRPMSPTNAGLQMFDRVRAEFGTLDILVANAGVQRTRRSREMTLAQWNKVLSVNLTGQFLCAREAIREFRRRGFGRISPARQGRSSA